MKIRTTCRRTVSLRMQAELITLRPRLTGPCRDPNSILRQRLPARRGKSDYVQHLLRNINKAEIPFPRDFFVVAGNASAKSQNDIKENITAITWWCENGPEDRKTRPRAALPQVTCTTHIQAILRFPDCVNEADIKDYTYAAANGGRCPASMKRMPQLRFSVRYDVRRILPDGWSGPPPLKLACGEVGEGYCFHGDFINGWFDDAAKNMLEAKSGRDFLRIDGAQGKGKAGSSCKAKDADPGNGTGDFETSLQMMKSG